ncbi:MAG TPA: hypothetical protein VEY51_15105, partial [Chondromyces sp.]|nr:hypothetical protein [Chondromyces sp.]
PFLFSEREHQNENIDNSMSSVTKKEDSYNKIASSYNNEMDKYNSINKSEISYNNDFYSYNKEENSVNNGDNSGSNEDNSCNKENSDNSEIHVKNTKEINLTSNLENEYNEKDETFPSSKEIEEELWEISELARRKKRLHPNVMEEIIVRLCSKKPLMLRELANLLERTPDGLRNNYLAKLLTKGRIKLKYPDQINHPKQAYIFVEKKEGERM